MLKQSFDGKQDINLLKDSELLLTNLNGTISFESSVKKIFISKLVDSEIIINVNSDVAIIFLHNKGSSNSKVIINMIKPYAHADVREVVITEKQDEFNKGVELIHSSKLSFSNYKFFGFAINDSQLKISAKSKVFRGMSGSEAHQILRVFTDDNAKAEGQPGLFVDDFDVKASHGNSIGQIDQRALYYLQTKGINRKLARWIIVRGQMTEALSQLDDDSKEKIILGIKKTLRI